MGVAVVNSWDEKAGFQAGCYAESADLTAPSSGDMGAKDSADALNVDGGSATVVSATCSFSQDR